MAGATRAIIVSILARGWAALLALLAVPWYVRYLGLEAYGVVGFFTSIQVTLTFLDLGLGATLTREAARLGSDDHALPYLRDLTRTFEAAFLVIALLICLLVGLLAPVLASHWLQLGTMQPDTVRNALMLAGAALACQWPTGLYVSGMTGLHRQAALGGATAGFGTLRVVLTLLALAWTPTLECFFIAQMAGALLQTLGLRILLWSAIALPGHRPCATTALLRQSLAFAGGMMGITLTSIILTQTDKMILSHVLKLEDFGLYAIASTLAAGVFVLITPLFSVIYPRFSALLAGDDGRRLGEQYHLAGQAMALLVIPLGVVAACFSADILRIWTHDSLLSERGALIFSLLLLGNAWNGVMHVPYALQLAAGWTRLAFWSNVIAIGVSVPAIIWAVTSFGAVGGAAVWALLNLAHIAFTPQFVHRRLLRGDKLQWYGYSVLMPSALAAAVAAAFAVLRPAAGGPLQTLSFISAGGVVALFAAAAGMSRIRQWLVARVGNRIAWVR